MCAVIFKKEVQTRQSNMCEMCHRMNNVKLYGSANIN